MAPDPLLGLLQVAGAKVKLPQPHTIPSQGQFMMERGRLVRVFRLDGFARTSRPRSVPELHELALPKRRRPRFTLHASKSHAL